MTFLVAHDVDPGRLELAALDVLTAAPWPGNVRELKQVVARLTLSANGSSISAAMVRSELSGPAHPRRSRDRAELIAVLEVHGWNLRRAARTLAIAPGTLYRRLRAAGLERPPKVSRMFIERSVNTRDSRASGL